MKDDFEATIVKYQKYVSDNEPIDTIILSLHTDEFTIVESIKAIKIIYKISLGDAKILVTKHPVWDAVVKAHEPFHEELIEMMTNPPDEE